MRYQCCAADPKHFSGNLRLNRDTKKLIWDTSREQDVIIVETDFGSSVSEVLDNLCSELTSVAKPLEHYNDYVEIAGVGICYVTAADKVKNGGCRLNAEGKTYSVLSCWTDGGVYKICQPAKNQSTFDIPFEIQATVSKITYTTGFIFKTTVDSGFYSISLHSKATKGYVNGSLCYIVGDLVIPVTNEMLEQGIIYVKTPVKPELSVKGNGIKIVKA